MRLPLRHPAPDADAPARRCAHLEALLEAAVGLPLRPAVALLGNPASRGRVGNALQWHLGLEAHDSDARLDWEDLIELKVVSVWRTADGRLACDKLKVCDANVDPAHKLSNVAFVFVDRVTRVVVGHRFWRLAGRARASLREGWSLDPHFDRAPIFIEARAQGDRSAPAYYLASWWMAAEICGDLSLSGVFHFDSGAWTTLREQGRGKDPLVSVLDGAANAARHRCPRCAGHLRLDPGQLSRLGVAPAVHGRGVHEPCDLHGHVAVDGRRLGRLGLGTVDELLAGIEARTPPDAVWRLADRVPEPEDHLHVMDRPPG